MHADDPGSNPVLISGLDLFPVVPDETLLCFVNSQLVPSCLLGFLIMFLVSLNCFFQVIKSVVPVNCSLIAKCTSTISKVEKSSAIERSRVSALFQNCFFFFLFFFFQAFFATV